MGDEFGPSLLTGFSEVKPKRGRPFLIDDSSLFHRRDDLVTTLEYRWAEVGWELQHSHSLPALRKALGPIVHKSGFELFVYPQTQKTNWTELRRTRAEEENLSHRLRVAMENERRAKERLERVLGALKDSGEEQLAQLVDSRTKTHISAVELVSGLKGKLEKCHDNLRNQEAYVAQSELVDFLCSGRYSITPLSVANAMAGLPFVAWRHSTARCIRTAANHGYGLYYEMFEHVTKALASPPRTAEAATEQVKKYLQSKRRTGGYSIVKLVEEDSYFLRTSIEAVYAAHVPKSALPYRVFAEYQRRSSTRSRYDLVMQEEERL